MKRPCQKWPVYSMKRRRLRSLCLTSSLPIRIPPKKGRKHLLRKKRLIRKKPPIKTKIQRVKRMKLKNQRNPMKLPRTMKPPREWTSSRAAKLRRRRLSPRNLVLRRSMIEIRRIEWQCVGIVGSYGMVQRAERSEGIDAFDSDSHGSRRSCREAAFAARFQRVFLSNGKGGEELRRSERWTTCRRSGETCGPRR